MQAVKKKERFRVCFVFVFVALSLCSHSLEPITITITNLTNFQKTNKQASKNNNSAKEAKQHTHTHTLINIDHHHINIMSDSAADNEGLCIERQSIIAIPARRASKDSSELSYNVQDDDLGLFDLIDEDSHWDGDASADQSVEIKRRAPRRMSLSATSSFNARSGGSVCSRSSMSSRSARSRASRLRATKSSDLDEMSISLKSQMTINSTSTGSTCGSVSEDDCSGSDGSRTPIMIKAKPIRKIAIPTSSSS